MSFLLVGVCERYIGGCREPKRVPRTYDRGGVGSDVAKVVVGETVLYHRLPVRLGGGGEIIGVVLIRREVEFPSVAEAAAMIIVAPQLNVGVSAIYQRI